VNTLTVVDVVHACVRVNEDDKWLRWTFGRPTWNSARLNLRCGSAKYLGGGIGYVYEISWRRRRLVIVEEAGHVIQIMTKFSSGMRLSNQLSAAKTPNALLSLSAHLQACAVKYARYNNGVRIVVGWNNQL